MHYVMIIKENSEQNLDIRPNLTCWAVQGERCYSPLLDLLWRACTTCKHFFDLQYTHRIPLSTFQVFLSTSFHFLHKIWCIFFDPFFSTTENRQHTQNTSNLYVSHKQTKNAILLKLWRPDTYLPSIIYFIFPRFRSVKKARGFLNRNWDEGS